MPSRSKSPRSSKKAIKAFQRCVDHQETRYAREEVGLCPRGVCTAKSRFDIYPSAYANLHGAQVCRGDVADFLGDKSPDKRYIQHLKKTPRSPKSPNKKVNKRRTPPRSGKRVPPLKRWTQERWVNVCAKKTPEGNYPPCGSSRKTPKGDKYPYCRPSTRVDRNTPKTVGEMTPTEIKQKCREKQSLEKHHSPSRSPKGRSPQRVTPLKRQGKRSSSFSSASSFPQSETVPIPAAVRKDAKLGLQLMEAGFNGGTRTGWDRAKQLAYDTEIPLEDLRTMRAWFARHGPDASSGGTSYPGYCNWVKEGRPMTPGESRNGKGDYRGAVAWLIWGGDAAYHWLKQAKVYTRLERAFPRSRNASRKNKLNCWFSSDIITIGLS